MATSQDTILDRLIINDVDSEDTLQDMADNDELEPNQLYMTPDETDGFIALPIGAIFPSSIPQTSSAFHLLDGSTISKTGMYAGFATLLQSLVTAGYNISCTQAQFDSDVSTYGQCGRFVIGDDTIRLPKITKYIEGLSNITDIGKSFEAGLPNITGSFTIKNTDVPNQAIIGNSGAFTGFSNGSSQRVLYDRSSTQTSRVVNFSASGSNSTYGKSTTVQTQSTAYPYYVVLANSYKTPVQVDIDQVASDINELNSSKLSIDKASYSFFKKIPVSTGVSSIQINDLDFDNYDYYFEGQIACSGTAGAIEARITHGGTVSTSNIGRRCNMIYMSNTATSGGSQSVQGWAWIDTGIVATVGYYATTGQLNEYFNFDIHKVPNTSSQFYINAKYCCNYSGSNRYGFVTNRVWDSSATTINGIKLSVPSNIISYDGGNYLAIYRRNRNGY